ncbi:hypothetical protein AMJ57_01015 [Parcubacteria bacterium SG8_24]|nr:MAG: hypothetical protein AMJ57_01015 [Parcubacteria bacterium SG8_24]
MKLMATRKKSVTACVKEIRRINTRFRRLKDKDGQEAERLMAAKDGLIDEMSGICPHPSVIATRGRRRGGLPRGAPRRICPRCGFSEAKMFQPRYPLVLTGRPTTYLPLDEYLIRQGQILRRLGINL